MEKNKIIFLDRDGTINVDYGYVYQKEKLEFIPGVIEGMKNLQKSGYQFIIVTNQSGIGRGYYTVNQYHNFNDYMINQFLKNDISILDIYFCPHTNEYNCNCRKPKTKLFYDAINKYNIDLKNSYVIGDKERDLSIAEETQIEGILLAKESNKYVCKDNLLEASKYIIKTNNNKH